MAEPYIIRKPLISIDGTDFVCMARSISLVPEDSFADVSTFCDPGGEIPGATTWTLSIEFLQSYGTDGLWNLLQAMAKQRKTFIVRPSSESAVGADNPEATFDAYVTTPEFLPGGAPGESMTFTFETTVIGDPVFAITAA